MWKEDNIAAGFVSEHHWYGHVSDAAKVDLAYYCKAILIFIFVPALILAGPGAILTLLLLWAFNPFSAN